MPPKRKSSQAGSRKKKKIKKSKGKKKGGTDWYTDGNDGDQDGTDLFSDDEEVNENADAETGGDGASGDEKIDDEEMVDEIEEEEEDQQNTSNATKRYDSLLSSLLSAPSASLAEADRRQLERVRLERQGIELAMSDDEEEEDEEGSSDESDAVSENEDEHFEAIDDEEEEETEQADTTVTKLDEDSAVSAYDAVYESHFGSEGLTKQQIKLVTNPAKWEYQHNSVKLPARGSNGSLALPAMRYSVKVATPVPELAKAVDDTLAESSNKKKKENKKATVSQATSVVMPYDFGMRPRLAKRWGAINQGVQNSIAKVEDPKDRSSLGLTGLQEQLLPHVLSYRDVVFTDRNIFNAVELREMYALHIMNHIFRSRDTVLRNTQKLKRHSLQVRADKTAAKAAKEMGVDAPKKLAEEAPDTDLMRDQGFTRARVLVVLPMRNAAARLMKLLIDLMPQGSQIQNRSRFFAEFGDEDVASETEKENAADFNEDEILKGRRGLGEEAVAEAAAQIKGKNKPRLLDRTPDWRATFEGNTDDCFRVGVAFPNRKSMRIFSDFYQSDLIIASPLGLRLATKQDVGASTGADSGSDEDDADEQASEDEKDEEEEEDEDDEKDDDAEPWEQVCKRGDVDFLSSIEVLVVDQADVFHMQNWQHLVDVTSSALNLQPKEVRPDTDFARVRPLFLEKTAALFRQTLVFSGHVDPYLNALTMGKLGLCRNAFGIVQVKRAKRPGAIMDVLSSFPQRFMRIDASEARLAKRGALQAFADARFAFFRDTVMPSLTGPAAAGTLVFVPSYFDFVRVRNLFAAADKEGKTRGLLDSLPARHGGDGPGGRKGAAKGKGKKKVVDTPEEATLFTTCSEYTEAADVTRARGDFFHGRARVMLTTERFHFFFRYKLRGIRRVVFYAPPSYGHFYSEMLNLVEDSDSSSSKKGSSKSSSLCLYTGGDALALESVVGSAHAAGMLAAEDPSQVFSYA